MHCVVHGIGRHMLPLALSLLLAILLLVNTSPGAFWCPPKIVSFSAKGLQAVGLECSCIV